MIFKAPRFLLCKTGKGSDLRKSHLSDVPLRVGSAHVGYSDFHVFPTCTRASWTKVSSKLHILRWWSPWLPLEIMFLVPVLNHCWALHTWCAFSPGLFLGEGEQKPEDQVLAAEQRCLVSIKIKGEHKSKVRIVHTFTIRVCQTIKQNTFFYHYISDAAQKKLSKAMHCLNLINLVPVWLAEVSHCRHRVVDLSSLA